MSAMPSRRARTDARDLATRTADASLAVIGDDQDRAGPLRAGDVVVFEALFRAHHAALCTFVFRMIRDRAVAEELVQEVFLRLWGSRAPRVVSRAYLYAAARNRTLNYLRHQRYATRWVADEGARAPDVAGEVTAADRVHYRDLHEAVRRAVGELPERARQVFTLRRDDGLTADEIAEALGLSVKTVENHLTRAVRALRRALAAHTTPAILLGLGAGAGVGGVMGRLAQRLGVA